MQSDGEEEDCFIDESDGSDSGFVDTDSDIIEETNKRRRACRTHDEEGPPKLVALIASGRHDAMWCLESRSGPLADFLGGVCRTELQNRFHINLDEREHEAQSIPHLVGLAAISSWKVERKVRFCNRFFTPFEEHLRMALQGGRSYSETLGFISYPVLKYAWCEPHVVTSLDVRTICKSMTYSRYTDDSPHRLVEAGLRYSSLVQIWSTDLMRSGSHSPPAFSKMSFCSARLSPHL